jgi:tetratricopeptide (TPR) repeat protein
MRSRRDRRGGLGRLSFLAAASTVGAVALLGGVAESDPPAAAARPQLAGLVELVSSGRTVEAVRALEAQNDGGSRTLLGLAYLQRFRETGDATLLSRAEAALRRGADPAVRTTGLASLAATRHRFGDARRLARAAIRLDPENATAYGVLGEALVELGFYRWGFAAYDRMGALSASVSSYARIAQARELRGSRAGALEALRLALELDGVGSEDRAYAHVRIGKLHQDASRSKAAERSYRAALRARPGYQFALSGLATLQLERGRPRAAIPALRRVLDELPSTETAIELGDALASLGRRREAEQAFALARRLERSLAANGVRTEIQSALFDLDHDRNLRSALVRARRGQNARPGIEGQHVLAWALYKNGRCEAARRHSLLALRLGTPDLDAIYHRSLIEACLGNEAAAQRFRARLHRLHPLYLRTAPSPYRLRP